MQVSEIRRYCVERNWTVLREIIDHGYSGSTDNRPGLKELLRSVRAKEIDVVIVVKLDRLFRSLRHLVSTLEEFDEIGVKFVAIRDNVDYSTPSGRFFVQILGSLGEFERSLLRERTMAGLEHARSLGKTFGRPRIHDESAIRNLSESGKTYREIRAALGAPMGTIARALNGAPKSALKIIRNPTYTTAQQTNVLRATDSPKTEIVPSEMPDKLSGETDLSCMSLTKGKV